MEEDDMNEAGRQRSKQLSGIEVPLFSIFISAYYKIGPSVGRRPLCSLPLIFSSSASN